MPASRAESLHYTGNGDRTAPRHVAPGPAGEGANGDDGGKSRTMTMPPTLCAGSSSESPGPVLVVEPSAAESLRLCDELRAGGLEVQACADLGAAEQAATRTPPGAILARWDLPTGGGLELLRRLMADATARWVPLILHGRRATAAERIEALDLGAFDVLPPTAGPAERLARLRAGMRLRERMDRLEHRAYRDSLTGLINRVALEDQLRRHWEASRRYGTSLSILLIDLDRFKQINDSLGHPAGDEALRRTASTLMRSVRASDIVARYGGDEFVVVAPNCPRTSALVLAVRFRAGIAAGLDPSGDSGRAVPITLSVGIAGTDGQETARIDDLVHQADQALYVAKRCGRDAVALYDPSSGGPRLVVQPSRGVGS